MRSRPIVGFIMALLLSAGPGATQAANVVVLDGAAPVIDGLLDESAWRRATTLALDLQVIPEQGGSPSEKTELRVLRDDKYLYLGVIAHDSQPQGILASELQRDRSLESDDVLRIVIDPYNRRSEGYWFEINPLGTRRDALIENGDDLVPEWDAPWRGKAQVTALGWQAEFAIPFSILSFAADNDAWAFNAERIIRRKQETLRWRGALRARPLQALALAGELTGFAGAGEGLGLQLTPRGILRDSQGGNNDTRLQGGLDAVYRITPSLTFTGTINADFAETDIDDREVNLSRFPLFFPEKREFFLQDAAYFRFGGISYSPYPFFSRSIGLTPDGEPVDIEVGAKLTGRTGPWTLGMLHARAEATTEQASEGYTVIRAAHQIASESSVGVLYTNGEPRADGDNSVLGVDLNLRASRWRPGKTVESHLWAVQSRSDLAGATDEAYGVQVIYPNEPWDMYFYVGHYGDDYDPGLGFVQRNGIREFIQQVRYVWRPQNGPFRMIDMELRAYTTTDLNGRVVEENYSLPAMSLQSHRGDRLVLSFDPQREVIDHAYDIVPGIEVPAGDYRYNRFFILAGLDSSRVLSGALRMNLGDFLNGHRDDYRASVNWRPSSAFNVQAAYELRKLRLATGNFDIRLASLGFNVNFGTQLSWSNVFQYDNISRVLGWNSRLRFIMDPDNDLYLVLNREYVDIDDHWSLQQVENVVKVGWTFTF